MIPFSEPFSFPYNSIVNFGRVHGRSIKVIVSIYSRVSSRCTEKIFFFNSYRFLFEETCEDKEWFSMCLRAEGVRDEEVSNIVRNLVFLANCLTLISDVPLSNQFCLFLSLMGEEERSSGENYRLQDAIDVGPSEQVPASENIIESLPRISFNGRELCPGNRNIQCMICLDNFVEHQTLLKMPCNHVFCELCLVVWLRINGVCPVCLFYIS